MKIRVSSQMGVSFNDLAEIEVKLAKGELTKRKDGDFATILTSKNPHSPLGNEDIKIIQGLGFTAVPYGDVPVALTHPAGNVPMDEPLTE